SFAGVRAKARRSYPAAGVELRSSRPGKCRSIDIGFESVMRVVRVTTPIERFSAPHGRGVVEFEAHFLPSAEASRIQQALEAELEFETRSIELFGRRILQPRLIAWAGELPYRYSGQTLETRAFCPPLDVLRARVLARTGVRFNHALVNLYRDGRDMMGFHSDAEPELGRDPVLASVSFGATRRFLLRSKR